MKSLDPKVIVVFYIKKLLGTAYILPIWFIGIFVFEKVWGSSIFILLLDGAGIIFFAFLILGCYYWSWLTFINFTYELKQDGLHVRSGVIVRRQVVIPYTDIETVDVLINPFVVRFLQLYTVRIRTRELQDTEGIFRKKQTLFIPGLTSEVAGSLRPELLRSSHLQERKTFFDPETGHYR